jgi:hypothetical protein
MSKRALAVLFAGLVASGAVAVVLFADSSVAQTGPVPFATPSATPVSTAPTIAVTAAALRDLILVWAPGRAVHIR